MATQNLAAGATEEHAAVDVSGALGLGCSAKDIVLAIIGKITTAGGNGHVMVMHRRYDPRPGHGRSHAGLQHVNRGWRAREAPVTPDQTTFDYVKRAASARRKAKRAKKPLRTGRHCRAIPELISIQKCS